MIVLIQKEDLSEVKGIVDSVPRTTPTPYQISMASHLSIRQGFKMLTVVKMTLLDGIQKLAEAEITDVDGIFALNHVQELKNLMLFDLFVARIEGKALLENGINWRFLNTSSDYSGKRPICHLVLSQIDDFEVDIRQMVCTVDSNHLILNMPDSPPLFVENYLGLTGKPLEDTNFSTFVDLSVSMSNFSVAVPKKEQILVGKIGNVKLSSNIISNSPTVGLAIALNNANAYIGINPRIAKFFQEPIKTQKKSFIEQLNVNITSKFRNFDVFQL
jgi:hypothetical protein